MTKNDIAVALCNRIPGLHKSAGRTVKFNLSKELKNRLNNGNK